MATISVACGVVFKEQRVFVCRRKRNKSLGGFWEFPGGKLESGESVEACLKRELREELEMEVEIIRHLVTVDHQYEHASVRLFAHACRLISYDGYLSDHDCYDWVCVTDLPLLNLAPADVPIAKVLADSNFA